VPRESLDAPENLPEQARRQVALGELQDEVPGVPNQAAAGLEESLLETRQRPALDDPREGEPARKRVYFLASDRTTASANSS
jgi:hypothetical protein